MSNDAGFIFHDEPVSIRPFHSASAIRAHTVKCNLWLLICPHMALIGDAMFFMIGVSPQRKDFEYHGGVMICERCGAYGRYRVFMTCMCLSLFFIPVFKWKKQYFAQTSCCGTTYALDPEIGQRIAHGQNVEILPRHLREVDQGADRGRVRRCAACGYVTEEDFIFCPKCGRRF